MYKRLLTFLRCPECRGTLSLEPLGTRPSGADIDGEIEKGLLHCTQDHWYPVVRGIPRMLPDSLDEHWSDLEADLPSSASDAVQAMMKQRGRTAHYDKPTRQNFSFEWDQYKVGDKTWGMDLDHRVKTFFLEATRIPPSQLDGMVMLDAGCGNGSQSVAYTEYGVEVIAVDLSSG
ncbi:MAG: class I SAM-dependent methyltransferase, partial [Actinomycetota bacterium]|nr:class I SAM-dependent methyltransferase [Actinomycetota bacterium]